VTLRPCQRGDAAAVAALDSLGFPGVAWDAAAVQTELGRAGAVGVFAPAAGFALGWALAGEAELVRIMVAPAARRTGLGGRLLDAFLAQTAARGAETTWLEVRVDNAPAIALYRGRGFTQRGQRRHYYADGTDALVMGHDAGGAA